MWHRFNLTAMESGPECTCVNNDDFTVPVSGGSRCTEWACVLCGHCIQMTAWEQQRICIKFHVKLKHSSTETIQMVQKAAAMGNWRSEASSWQCASSCIMSRAEFLGETPNQPADSASLQPRFGTLWLLAFPTSKITFEREEIPEHWWNSGKFNRTVNGYWENCVRSQSAYSEGDWDTVVLCTMFLVSCIFFNKCLFFMLRGWIPSGQKSYMPNFFPPFMYILQGLHKPHTLFIKNVF